LQISSKPKAVLRIGWPVGPVEPVKKLFDFILLTGERANGQRAQPAEFEYFGPVHNAASGH